jgi:hypothetical protein
MSTRDWTYTALSLIIMIFATASLGVSFWVAGFFFAVWFVVGCFYLFGGPKRTDLRG